MEELLLEFDQLTASNDTLLGTNGGSNATTNETGFEENDSVVGDGFQNMTTNSTTNNNGTLSGIQNMTNNQTEFQGSNTVVEEIRKNVTTHGTGIGSGTIDMNTKNTTIPGDTSQQQQQPVIPIIDSHHHHIAGYSCFEDFAKWRIHSKTPHGASSMTIQ